MTTTSAPTLLRPDGALVERAIDRRSFATLATVSPAGRPHVAGVLYGRAGDAVYVSTLRASRKARNIAANGHAALCIPVRRLPVGPPSTVQFQATATVLDLEDPALLALVDGDHLRSVTRHGELDLPGGCFLCITIPPRVRTYGLGLPLRRLLADPLAGGGEAPLAFDDGEAPSLPTV